MSPRGSRRVLRPGTPSVFVGGGATRAPFSMRLDVREEVAGGKPFFGTRKRSAFARGRHRLFHYIAAGGMRQLRRTSADEREEDRRRTFLLFLGLTAVLWLVFYLVPSV